MNENFPLRWSEFMVTFRMLLEKKISGKIINVIFLSLSTLVCQLIPVVILPMLSRIYTPDQFGIFALFISVSSVFSVISTGRYELSLVLPERDEDAAHLFYLCLIVTTSLSFFLLLIVITSQLFVSHYSVLIIKEWIIYVPISVLLSGFSQTLTYWANRKREFNKIVEARISNAIVSAIFTILMGLIYPEKSGLIIGFILGQAISVSLLLLRTNIIKVKTSADNIYRIALQYRDFPRINAVHALSDMTKIAILSFLIGCYYGNAVLGLYSLTIKIINSPISLLGTSVFQVIYRDIVNAYYLNNGTFEFLVRKFSIILFGISISFFLLILIIAPSVTVLIFGEAWKDVGYYAQVLVPWASVNLIVSSLSQIPLILGRQGEAFRINLVTHILTILSCAIISVLFREFEIFLYVLSFFGTLSAIIYGHWILYISKE